MSDASSVVEVVLRFREKELLDYLGKFPADMTSLVACELASCGELAMSIFSQLVQCNLTHGSMSINAAELHGRMLIFSVAAAPVIAEVWRPGSSDNLARLVRGHEEYVLPVAKELSDYVENFHKNQLFVACAQNSMMSDDELADFARGATFSWVVRGLKSATRSGQEMDAVWTGQHWRELLPHVGVIRSRNDWSRGFLEVLASGIAPVLSEGVI